MGNAKLGMERSIEMPNAASVEASDSPKNPEYFRTARMPILATTAAKTIRRFFRLQASRISRLPELLSPVAGSSLQGWRPSCGARVHDCRRQGDERDKRAAEREEEAVAGKQEHRHLKRLGAMPYNMTVIGKKAVKKRAE